MSNWYHYIITEDNPVSVDDIGAALQQTNRAFYVDADLILKMPTAESEPDFTEDSPDLICGQVTFLAFENGLQETDEPEFYEWAEETKRRSELESLFNQAKSMVTVQVINGGGNSEVYEESIAPLWDWLLTNRQGILVTDDGAFYNVSGRIE